MTTRKIISKFASDTSNSYIGNLGDLIVDTQTKNIKIADGITPGGISIQFTSITSSLTGLIKASSGILSAAISGVDYIVPGSALGTPYSGNLLNCTFPILNQNTSGYASSLKSATTIINVSAAAAPGANQALVSIDATSAHWVDVASTFGSVTEVSGAGNVNGITLSGVISSTGSLVLGGALANVSLTSQVTGILPVSNGGTGSITNTGTGAVVLANSPTLITPFLGIASASTINKVDIVAPDNGATLILANNSTLITAGTFSTTITSIADTNVTLPISGTLINSDVATLSSLTSVGTISTGTWHGTAIDSAYITANLTGKTYNGISPASLTTGFTISGGTTSKTLSINNTITLAGNDSATLNIGTGGTLGANAYTDYPVSIAGGNNTNLAGAVLYQSNLNTTSLVSPNTLNTALYLTQIGNGTTASAPTWGSITSLGTISTGVWGATPIASSYIASTLTGKSYNGLLLTAFSSAFTITGGTTAKTLTVNNTIALSGTDSSTLNIGTGGTLSNLATAVLSGTPSTTTYLRGDNSWQPAGASISNDNATNASYYIGMSSTTTGAWTTAYVSSSKLYFNPSTGKLSATSFNGLTLTPAASGFTIAGGTASKTLTVNNTIALSGTDSATLNIGAGGTLNSFTTAAITGTPSASTYLRGDNSWQTLAGGSGGNLSDDTTSNVNYYIGMASTTTGAWTNAYVASTKLYFNPSTGNLRATTYNSLTLSAAANGFTIAGGTAAKTLTVNNTIALSGTDNAVLNIGIGGTLNSFATATIAGTPSTTTYLRGDNTWQPAGSSITDDLVSNAFYYIGMSAANTGAWTTAYIASSKLYFNPSTGTLFANAVNGITLTPSTTGFTIAGGTTSSKSVTINNSITLSGTDASTLNIGTGGTLGSAAYTATTAYQAPIGTITGVTKGNGANLLTAATAGIDYSAGTSALATGIIKSTTTTGVLSIAVAGTDYTAGTSALATGMLKNTTTTGAHSIAVAGTDYTAGTSALATGILKNTTTTGAHSIAVAADFPTLNQNTTGYATHLAGGSTTTLLGAVPYQSNTNVTSLLAPNTTTVKQFLSQTGTGTNGAAPTWATIVTANISDIGTWAGNTSITSTGTIATGTWNATTIADGKIASALTGKTYNALSLTAATSGFTIAGGTASKTLTVNNTITLSGTDSSTLNIGSGGTLNSLSTTTISGTPSSSTYLRGDNSWQPAPTGASVTNDTTTNTSYYISMTNATTGTLAYVYVSDAKLSFNPSTGRLAATSFNGLTLSTAATGFTIAGGTTSKTLTVSNTLALSGTDASTLNIGAGGTLNSLSTATITGTANSTTYLRGDNSWQTVTSGATITNDIATNTNYFLGMAAVTTGSWTSAYVSNTLLYFNPSSGTLNATNFNSLSDISTKDNITTIVDSTNTITKLRGVEFNWKSNQNKSSGVIAQEIETVLPWLVEGDELKSVNYSGLLGYMIESIKELNNRIQELELLVASK